MGLASLELSRREGSHPPDNILSKADQDNNHPWGKGTGLAHVQFSVQKDTQVLFCNTAFEMGDLQHISGVWNCSFLGAALSNFPC